MSRAALPIVMAALGVVLLVRTAAAAGLGANIGTIVGVALAGIGAGRTYLALAGGKGGSGS